MKIKIWGTKYWISDGITEHEFDECVIDELIVIRHSEGWILSLHGEGKEWHRRREDAVIRVEDLRKKKIEGLKRKITKLSAMDFNK